MTLKLRYLRYFAVLAEELHFGRAAARLAITQPPLSGTIKALEEELGTPLFIRSSRHVELTPAGAAFRVQVRGILANIDRAAQLAQSVGAGQRGRLNIGITGSLVYREAGQIVREFSRLNPAVDVVLHELSSAIQIDELLRGQLDAGFVNATTVPSSLDSVSLADDCFVCCLPASHPLAEDKAVRLQDVQEEPFIMFTREVAPANYDNVVAVFSQSGIHPRLVHAARQWLTVIALVAHGLGIALVPESLVRSGMHGVVFLPLLDLQTRTQARLAWPRAMVNAILPGFLHVAQQVIDGNDGGLMRSHGPDRGGTRGRR